MEEAEAVEEPDESLKEERDRKAREAEVAAKAGEKAAAEAELIAKSAAEAAKEAAKADLGAAITAAKAEGKKLATRIAQERVGAAETMDEIAAIDEETAALTAQAQIRKGACEGLDALPYNGNDIGMGDISMSKVAMVAFDG